MATKKITDLTELSATPASNDVVAIVDIDADVTKKITISNLQSGISSTPFPFTGDASITGSLTISGSLQLDYNGNGNMVIGSGSGEALTTGTDNIIFGNNAAQGLDTGTDNIIIGKLAAKDVDVDDGANLILIGKNVASNGTFTSEDNSVAIGTEAGKGATLANSVFIGYQAGASTGYNGANQSIAIGSYALSTYGGNYNIAIGYEAMLKGYPGATIDNNIAIGYQAMKGNSNYAGPRNNIAIGHKAMEYTTTNINVGGGENTVIGYEAARPGNGSRYFGTKNIVIGYQAGQNSYTTDATHNIIIGPSASLAFSGSSDTLIIASGSSYLISGSFATGDILFPGQVSASSYIGDGSALTGISGGGGNGTLIASGSVTASTDPATGFVVKASGSTLLDVQGSLGSMFSVSDSFDGNLFEVNNISGISLLSVSSSGDVDIPKGVLTVSGSVSASKFLGDGSALTGVGGNAFPFTGDAQITGSLIVSGSFNAFRLSTNDVILGEGAGNNTTVNANGNVIVGYQAGYTNTTGDKGVIIGYQAGYNLGSNASNANVLIGEDAGRGGTVTTGGYSYNVFIGRQPGYKIERGTENVGIGRGALHENADGDSNVAIGYAALYNTTAGDNIGIGHYAGVNQTSGDGNITIGSGSLGIAGESNQLRIGNSNSFTLISGSLSDGGVKIQGQVSASSYIGDGSALTGVGGNAFPFTGDAQITGSLTVSGSSLNLISGSFRVVSPTRGTMFNIDDNTFTLGPGASAVGGYTAVAIGHNASTSGNYSVSIGSGATTNANTYAVAIGGASVSTTGLGGVAIGGNGTAAGSYGVSMGYQASGTGNYSINLGRNSRSTGANSVTFNTSGDTIAAPSNTRAFNLYLTDGTGNPDLLISASNESKLSGSSFTIEKSGSTVFSVVGSTGTLFEVDDSLTGTIFTANDASGLPILQADSTGEVYLGKSPQSLYTTRQISSTVSTHTESIYQIDTSSLFTSAVFDYTCVSQSNATAGQIRAVWIPGTDLISFTDNAVSDIGTTVDVRLSVEITQSKASFLSKTNSAGWQIKTIIRSI